LFLLRPLGWSKAQIGRKLHLSKPRGERELKNFAKVCYRSHQGKESLKSKQSLKLALSLSGSGSG